MGIRDKIRRKIEQRAKVDIFSKTGKMLIALDV